MEYCIDQQWDFEIIIAEDGSTDNTVAIVQDFCSKDSRVKLLSFKDRLGKGGAIRNAILTAKKEYAAFMDADLSADPSEFQRLLKYINEHDMVIGSRKIRDGLPSIKISIQRKIFSYAYSKIFRVLFRIPIYDPQCGFKLFKRQIVSPLFQEINSTGFAFDSEIIVKAYSLGLGVKEVGIIWNHDSGSKINVIKQVREMGKDLISIWYESHLLWLQHKPVYPQKKGSLEAKLFFSILRLCKKPK